MLISPPAGHRGTVMRAYRDAVARCYRFFSGGDAMWLPAPQAGAGGAGS
jgi:S-adenosylmethionine:tRNA-ribosyltransferase-isomerase (queuine synthetase)